MADASPPSQAPSDAPAHQHTNAPQHTDGTQHTDVTHAPAHRHTPPRTYPRADTTGRADRVLGGRRLAAMLPDPAGARPVYRHLARAIGALILDGHIALHVRLPAERELAAALNISRPTVTAVYDLLREDGYAHSRQGSGTWTALPEGRTPSGVARLLGPRETAIDLARAAPAFSRRRSSRPSPASHPTWPRTCTPPATTPTGYRNCAPPSPSASSDGACPPCPNRSW
ncbi:GntR family transcriptional regulator [Streptomyces sp. CA-132043]|uniref:GntR family transcriptional regulator n=1 Tax=Streptomyces sp. CA-132043 TaxID=3240048 RepID=UPI003D92EC34